MAGPGSKAPSAGNSHMKKKIVDGMIERRTSEGEDSGYEKKPSNGGDLGH